MAGAADRHEEVDEALSVGLLDDRSGIAARQQGQLIGQRPSVRLTHAHRIEVRARLAKLNAGFRYPGDPHPPGVTFRVHVTGIGGNR